MQNSNNKLSILFLAARFPYPLIGGDLIKPYYVLKYLASKHNVTLITFNEGNKKTENDIKAIEKLGINLKVIPFNPTTQLISGTIKFLNKMPLEAAYYLNKRFKKEVDKTINNNDIDLIISFMIKTAEYSKDFTKIPKILIQDDCKSLYYEKSAKNTTNIIQKIVRKLEAKNEKKYEPAIVNHFNVATYVSQEDLNAIKKLNSSANYKILSNGVDLDRVSAPEDNSHRKDVIFIGRLDVWANQLSVKRLIDSIFPKIKEQIPDAKLNIVGANPPEFLQKLNRNDINLKANVPELRPYLNDAAVFIHPHYSGTGIQNKVLEAMACGCPVSTTPSGCQGIDAVHKENIMIGKDDDELAENSVKLLNSPNLVDKLAKNGRKTIIETKSWSAINNQIDEVINEAING